MQCRCPHCGAQTDASKGLFSDSPHCSSCGKDFVIESSSPTATLPNAPGDAKSSPMSIAVFGLICCAMAAFFGFAIVQMGKKPGSTNTIPAYVDTSVTPTPPLITPTIPTPTPRTDGTNPVVIIETSEGTIKAELFDNVTPITVKNFLDYVDARFYDGTIFHRVMETFMIQGGGFTPGMAEKKTNPSIRNESQLRNERGTLAMARTNDPDSATAQFYINVVDNSSKLDRPRYCVFGRVTEGMDVVDKIRKVRVSTKGMHENVPIQDVIIKSIRRQ